MYLTALRSIGFLNSSSHTNRFLQTSVSTPRNLKNKSVKIVCVSSLICRPPENRCLRVALEYLRLGGCVPKSTFDCTGAPYESEGGK